ncbi:MAG: PTS sugar transporter subunit IIA [Verrucomicrobiota bacterium]|jgi:PTS system fructose-specific IIA component|nr:MAG: PTS sugar transporter subunit IIA [Verrucomicrobiota bacterium]
MRSILTALQDGRLFELPEGADKARVLAFLARILDANPNIESGIDAGDEVVRREQEGNTAVGLGVAVPHVRGRKEEGELFCAIGWSAQGVNYLASDDKPVHLVVMYYIPGAQKNIYLKEISSLVKAIKKSGGIEPISGATDLNAVRNQLLDWVSSGLGDAGPESVARMIRLEVRTAQASHEPASEISIPAPTDGSKVNSFNVLITPTTSYVLGPDSEWTRSLEKDPQLSNKLAAGHTFSLPGFSIIVTSSKVYPAARILYECVAVHVG